MKKERFALFLSSIAYTIFGFSFIFSSMVMEFTSPMVLLGMRFLFAFLLLNLLVLTKKFEFSLKGKPIWMLLAMGVFQPLLYFFCENYGIYYTSSAFSGAIIGFIPVVGLILGVFLLHEKATKLQVICAVLSVIGVFLTTVGSEHGQFSLVGFLLLLGAVFSSCFYTIVSKKASEYFNALEKTYVMFALGTVVFLSMMLYQTGGNFQTLIEPFSKSTFWIAILYLGGFSSVGAFMLLNYAITYTTVTQNSVLANFATVISIIAGIVFLGDSFSVVQMIGAAIIVLSVWGITVPNKNN